MLLVHYEILVQDLPEIPSIPKRSVSTRRQRIRASSEGVSSMREGFSAKRSSADNKTMANAKDPKEEIFAQKTRDVDKSDVVNGGHSGSATLLTSHASSLGRHGREQRRRLMKTQSDGVSFMRSSLPAETARSSLESIKEMEPEKQATLTEVAQISTKDLPNLSDPEFSQKVKRKARQRTKAASEGVALMRAGRADKMSLVATTRASMDDTAVANSAEDLQGSPPMQKLAGVTQTECAKSKVTFFLGKSRNVSATETSLDIREAVSFDSTASEDGDSVFDDVPKAFIPDIAQQSRLRTIEQKVDLAAFFEGSQYRTISLIFGPMACFFFVAMRVEIFNIYAGTFVDQTNIWREMLAPCFWVQVFLYCLMIIEMILVLLVFFVKRGREGTLFSCSAAIFGILINVMCLLLLLVAEMKRCCPDENETIFMRLLGPAPKGYDQGYEDPADEIVPCCPSFGERRYGGLGKIEPFTCLIALSPLRFLVAGYLVRLCGKGTSCDEDKGVNHESHGHHHGPDPTTKVRDLWMTAIGVHSEIYKLFGPFSGELLQCMLGIYSAEVVREESEVSLGNPESSDAFEITKNDSSSHHGRENSMDVASNASSKGIMSPSKSPTVRRHQYFEYPEARLIRRMRRCEMRLLPLLTDEWIVVDVVMTNHELILFDTLDETDKFLSTPENAISTNKKAGGKALPLCEVAEGRVIMDQFDLDDVDFVGVERRAATPVDDCDEDIEKRNALLEYWEGGNSSNGDYDANAMNKRWGRVDEDRLKIHFTDKQTLYLRFMVDLKEMEEKRKELADDPDLMHHIGTHTKLWCRCIANLRGAMNLKQHLPNFGDQGTEEMEDFIEICEREDESFHHNANKFRKSIHRRIGSFHLMMDNLTGTEN